MDANQIAYISCMHTKTNLHRLLYFYTFLKAENYMCLSFIRSLHQCVSSDILFLDDVFARFPPSDSIIYSRLVFLMRHDSICIDLLQIKTCSK